MKDKWTGDCLMCYAKNQKLSTTQTTIGPMKYWIRRCCDHCQRVMRYNIDHTMLILVADRKQLDEVLLRRAET